VNLADENGDDPIYGSVDFTVIADVIEWEAVVEPVVIEPTK